MRTIPARRSAGKRDSARGTKGLVVRHPVHNNIPDRDRLAATMKYGETMADTIHALIEQARDESDSSDVPPI